MTIKIKTRPIIFSAEMVNAVLDGRKTQTRKLIKCSKEIMQDDSYTFLKASPQSPQLERGLPPSARNMFNFVFGSKKGNGHFKIKCPFGKIGDRLWVRETWQIHEFELEHGGKEFPNILYKSTGSTRLLIDKCVWKFVKDKPSWRSPVTMPRWASRITLEITNIQVERLQDISEEDCLKEGIIRLDSRLGFIDPRKTEGSVLPSVQEAFQQLWHSTKGKWDQNPWVWVISFRRVI